MIFAFHGYPWLIHRLTYRRHNHDHLHVRGYKEEGTTTTPFDMLMLNDLDRFHLVADVIDRVPALGAPLRRAAPAHARRAAALPRPHPPHRRGRPGRTRLGVAGLMRVLVVNAGSSSIKIRLLDSRDALVHCTDLDADRGRPEPGGLETAVEGLGPIDAVGHRVVHGGPHRRGPVLVDDDVLVELDSWRRSPRCTSHRPSPRCGPPAPRSRACPRSPASTPPSTPTAGGGVDVRDSGAVA